MKKPENLTASASRIWDVFEAWQRIDLKDYCRFRHARMKSEFRKRTRARLQILRTKSL